MVGLGDLPGGAIMSDAKCVSQDGNVIGGVSISANGWEAFRWTAGTGMVGLGDLPGGSFLSFAAAMTPDGSTLVGSGTTANGKEAFIWDATRGMRNIRDILVNDCGLDLTGWTLTHALGISADGLTICGQAYDPAGYPEAWIATIPEPASILILLGAVATTALRRPH